MLDLMHLNHTDGGKYSDVSFISKKISHSPVKWTPEVLMLYRTHLYNDSKTLNILDYIKLWKYMLNVGINRNDKSFKKWRNRIWKEWLLQHRMTDSFHKIIIPYTWRERVIHNAVLLNEIWKPYKLIFWRLFIGLLISKLIHI
jgi:hypothetical protein